LNTSNYRQLTLKEITMNDTWFKVIDFLQSNFWWGVGLSGGSFTLLLVLAFVVPSGKKKKKVSEKPEIEDGELAEIAQATNSEEAKRVLLEYQATLDSKDQEIAAKNDQIEELDRQIETRSADLNILEDLPEEVEKRITTSRRSIHTRYYWYGLVTGLFLAATLCAVYYYFWVIKGGI